MIVDVVVPVLAPGRLTSNLTSHVVVFRYRFSSFFGDNW